MSDDEIRIKEEPQESPTPDEKSKIESINESLNSKVSPKNENPPCSSGITMTGIKSTPINGISWPSSAWEDGSRRSAFHPYKPTVLTNLQRGNGKANDAHNSTPGSEISWFENAGRGNIGALNLIKKQVNEWDQDGLTALMWSSAYGQTPLVQKLIKAGADVNKKGKEHQTPLHLASAGGHHDVIKILLANGANVNEMDQDGNTPLLYAVYGDHPFAVDELLNGGADLTMRNHEGVKPYSLAVRANCHDARLVLENYLLDKLEENFNKAQAL